MLGKIEAIEEEPDSAIARVSLFPSVPQLLVEGLAVQQYGASFRGEPLKNHFEHRPERSDHNPQGIPEVTRLEIRLRDVGPTPFCRVRGDDSANPKRQGSGSVSKGATTRRTACPGFEALLVPRQRRRAFLAATAKGTATCPYAHQTTLRSGP